MPSPTSTTVPTLVTVAFLIEAGDLLAQNVADLRCAQCHCVPTFWRRTMSRAEYRFAAA